MRQATATRGNYCHCLLIEDNKFDQRRVERILHQTMPSRLSTVETLCDAYRALQQDGFDLVIANNTLPDGLGIDFVRRLRMTQAHRHVPVIMTTDQPSSMIKTRAYEAGATTVVTKARLSLEHVRDLMREPELTQAS